MANTHTYLVLPTCLTVNTLYFYHFVHTVRARRSHDTQAELESINCTKFYYNYYVLIYYFVRMHTHTQKHVPPILTFNFGYNL